MGSAATVSGDSDAKFDRVRDVLSTLLSDGREVGCSVCVYVDGQKVVDLWGGLADPKSGRAWDQNTIVSTFSVSKALVSTMGHMLVDRGVIDLDEPVAKFWPAFGQIEHFLNALVDCFDVVTVIFGKAVERDVFAGVVDFLLHEGADLSRQFGRGAVAMCLDRFDEESLTARESG